MKVGFLGRKFTCVLSPCEINFLSRILYQKMNRFNEKYQDSAGYIEVNK